MYYFMKKSILISVLIVFPLIGYGQEDSLLKELESLSENEQIFELPAFKALQIGNLQSTKVVSKGDLYLVVAHRFGYLKNGITDFFGLDQANTKIQLLYGIKKNLQLGVSRDSYQKTYSGTAKYRLLKQSNKLPLNVSLYGSIDVNSQLKKSVYPGLKQLDRFSYTAQILAARRFSEKLSLQIAPIFVRHNLQDLNYTKEQTHNQVLLGTGGRYKLSNRFSVNFDYVYNFTRNKNSLYLNPLTIGVDIETGGHVFQLLFTNSRASNDSSFLTETLGDWSKGQISFGFNIVRVF
tara:strand:- start:245 stop:1123 length:879 start_codon:yes stop_codon:yes gene_type:complete